MRLPLALFTAWLAFSAERATITGKVIDPAGQPVDHATVLVYKAGVKTGYSTYCPTCYVDCGKQAVTQADGSFALGSLSPDLLFTLLVLHEGHATATIDKVDPAKSPAEPIALKPRIVVEDTSRVVRGRVMDLRGNALAGAVVEQQGVMIGNGQRFGDSGWTDLLAVSNAKGEFELAYGAPASKLIFSIAARGMASKLFTSPTGAARETFTVEEGATVRGRLLHNGKPLANAEVGLVSHSRRSGNFFPEVRIGTQPDGTFAITNVPAGRVWLAYAKMDSLVSRGVGGSVVELETKDNGQEINLGDLPLVAAYKLAGKVVLTDGTPIPEGMRVSIFADRAIDSQTAILTPDGQFEFQSLPAGIYTLNPSVKGYGFAQGFDVETLVHRDVSGLVITLQPQTRP